MTFYAIIAIVLLFILLKNRDQDVARKQFVIITTMMLVLLSCLRNEAVGNDTFAYLRYFDDITNTSWKDIFGNFWDSYFNPSKTVGKDPAMQVLNKVLSLIISNHTVYLFIIASILLVPLGVFIYKNTSNLSECLFGYTFYITLYYTYLPNSAIRQSIALGIIILGYLYYQKQHKVLYFALIIIAASLFHKSSLIVFVFLGLSLIRNYKKVYVLMLPVFILMLFFYNYVGFALASQSEIYEMYAEGYYGTGSKPFMVIILFIGLYLIGLFQVRRFVDDLGSSADGNLMLIGAGLCTVFVPLIRMDPSMIRMTSYFVIWSFVFIPKAIERYQLAVAKLLFVVILLLFSYRALNEQSGYAFNWQQMELHERYN